MITRTALPMLALLLSACATRDRPPQPIPVLAEQRLCPAYPLPPRALLKPPVRIDFLTPTSAPAGTEGLSVPRTR